MRISDWSSDVCSSDLCSDHLIQRRVFDQLTDHRFTEFHRQRLVVIKPLASLAAQLRDALPSTARAVVRRALQQHAAIGRNQLEVELALAFETGRASRRERECPTGSISGIAVTQKKKK